MNISGISAITAAFGGYYPSIGSGSGSGDSKSVTTQANGATITTLRGATQDIVSVTTVAPVTTTSPAFDASPQSTESTVDVTA